MLAAAMLWGGLQLPTIDGNVAFATESNQIAEAGNQNAKAGNQNAAASNQNAAASNQNVAAKAVKPVVKKITGPELKSIRYGNGNNAERQRIVMDLSQAMEFDTVTENNGKRLVVTMYGIDTLLKGAPELDSYAIDDIILGKYGSGKDTSLQLIVDMVLPLPTKVYTLKNPDRLVIDVTKDYENNAEMEPYPGLKYNEYVRLDRRGMFSAYVLDVDRKKFDVKLVLAGGNISSGRDKLSSIASDNNAVAAVNAGYFNNDGSMIGCNRIGGKTAGTVYYTRSSMGFLPDGNIKFGTIGYDGIITLGRKSLNASGVNVQRTANSAVIYNSLYGSRTGTNQYGMEYTVQGGKVTAVQRGNSVIPADGHVISVHGKAMTFFKGVKVGDKAEVYQEWGEDFNDVPDIIGAGPMLLSDGKVHITSVEEEFPADIAVGQAPRTAIGVTSAGHILLAVIDGRQARGMGATLQETAEFMQRYGAVDALNLDGGGSSEMVLNGEIMNSPSDGGERSVGSAVVVLKK